MLLSTVEECFLLVGLVPKALAGSHALVKYSEHWELLTAERTDALSRWEWVLASTGWRTVALGIDLNDAGLRPSSYHVEVHTPSGLVSEELIVQSRSDEVPMARDPRHTSVSHVAVRGDEIPQEAAVALGITTSGLLARAAIAYSASAVLFLVASVSSVAGRIFDPASRSSTSLFLAVIAVVLASLTRDAENPVSSRFLLPLRLLLVGLAAAYFVAAAFVAIGVGFDLGVGVFRIELVLLLAGSVLIGGGYLTCRRRQVGRVSAPRSGANDSTVR